METRSAPRINIKLKVICRIHEDFLQKFGLACGDVFEVSAADISESGIGVVSKYFLPKGLILELKIDGILKETMKIKGEIRYCNYKKDSGYRCGIKFLDLSDEYRKAIAELIATYEKRKFPRVRMSE